MSNSITLGGERLGSGKKQKVKIGGFERSTHDLSNIFRTTMSAGTLVPFMTEVGLPGDTFDIDLDVDVLTHPTIGPLFGSFKIQLDMYKIPIRLYNGKIQMNKLNIGRNINQVKLPKIKLYGNNPVHEDWAPIDGNYDNYHVNPSSILSYLGINGLGYGNQNNREIQRKFNAVPLLAYWDIFKNYYANKQEEKAYVIHNNLNTIDGSMEGAFLDFGTGIPGVTLNQSQNTSELGHVYMNQNTKVVCTFVGGTEEFDPNKIMIQLAGSFKPAMELFSSANWNDAVLTLSNPIQNLYWNYGSIYIDTEIDNFSDVEPRLMAFDLEKLDTIRESILANIFEPEVILNEFMAEPFNCLENSIPINEEDPENSKKIYSIQSPQEGLAVKTYQSDIFNNWINTEWIDGEGSVNDITKLALGSDGFTIDEFNVTSKIYKLLNKIALSGGTYDDYLDVAYDHERVKAPSNPMYMGGLSKELIFQEVISNAGQENEPLGTLAGRGVVHNGKKGGKVVIKVEEPSYIMGIVSITPRIDYSQGNKWDVNLDSFDDFHKPDLDQIGFQELITEQMHAFETHVEDTTFINTFSAGKQTAWLNYQTNYNKVHGNFALQNQQMWMTLNRRYELQKTNGMLKIKDLTTYIDPKKFNHIFADTRRDAMNFWTQISIKNIARRKMSAKVMPNL